MTTPLMAQLKETSSFIHSKIQPTATTAIILGSGLGNLASQIKIEFDSYIESIANKEIFQLGNLGTFISKDTNYQFESHFNNELYQPSYTIDQNDADIFFNYGKLCNIGFDITSNNYDDIQAMIII